MLNRLAQRNLSINRQGRAELPVGGSNPGSGVSIRTLAAAIFALPLYPVLGMLWPHHYPVFSLEVVIIVTASLALAVSLAGLLLFTRPFVRNLLLALLVIFAFLFQFNLLFLGIIGVFSAAIVLSFIFRARFPEVVLWVVAAMICGSWLDSKLGRATRLSELEPAPTVETAGPVIHLLMDGFSGPDGIPDPALSGDLREEVVSFFQNHGFELHTRAYSHYGSTLDSMTRAFNFRNDGANLFRRAVVLRQSMEFAENRWFSLLDSAGYQLNVYQSESMNFCGVPLSRDIHCNTFPMPNLRTLHRDLHPPLARVPILLSTLLSQSGIMTGILRDARILGSWGVSVYDKQMLAKLADDVKLRPGDAYFAHVLVPHAPLVFREDCSIDYAGHPGMRWSADVGLRSNTEQSRKARYPRIVSQTKCAMKLLEGLFSSLEEERLFESATLIVHGDHGSSAHIYSPSVYNLERLSQDDYREAFSTLFAVKWPNGSFRTSENVASLNVLMADVATRFAGDHADALGIGKVHEPEPFVYLTNVEPLRKVYVNIFEEPTDSGRLTVQEEATNLPDSALTAENR